MTKRQFLTLVALSTVILCGVLYLIFVLQSIKVGTTSTGLVRVVLLDNNMRSIPNTSVTFESSHPPLDSTKITSLNGQVHFAIDCLPYPVPYTVSATDSLGIPHIDSGIIAAGQIDNDTIIFSYTP